MSEFTKKKEMRIALCKECNFDCFFCHSEGLDREGHDSRQPMEEILSLIDRSRELGFTDITFIRMISDLSHFTFNIKLFH